MSKSSVIQGKARRAVSTALLALCPCLAVPAAFRDAPAAMAKLANAQTGPAATAAGGALYQAHCAGCHGAQGQGGGNIPSLSQGAVQQASDGAVFWFISAGAADSGMPSWSALPEMQRWQIVSYLKALRTLPAGAGAADAVAGVINAPPPQAPFTDFRYQAPGVQRRITAADLPAPYATASAGNRPTLVRRPADAWPLAPKGFTVSLYAEGLAMPRVIHAAPNGDVFVAESGGGRIRVFRGMTAEGKPQSSAIFASG